MSIYTKTGDKGTTSLFDNKRVSKDDIRVESYGTVDELVSFLGLAKNYVDDEKIFNIIQTVQNKLFTLASILATEDEKNIKYRIVEEDIEYLEKHIDEYMRKLGNPTGFIIPGSGKKSGYLHVCRTICRRAERRIITLSKETELDSLIIKYINRLSDLIYALARFLENEEVKVEYRA
ncbi:cob(I)yrinic acid a,c-diamide adenosyltransferase [Tepidimicrobium xylanilyticum]|uniref:Corrinoid adenosyltransferase n=1 Tax=Tepidimicrobium xylanilyticum TaxID=1123352 RepID=A0A1H2XLF7_9FIRM|nr:cob(I)yrinic acid a,c-diamide adenosyltransferase [Tepidimicrobium xylanilyticum]GMG97537.1 cobalamin adenosyltransferase [Tepidimicrobium xylanilyticum]SDW93712.1 cob(I)alamin adenosyltransferase [Tepidimicrobium xylanilyticum]